MYPIASQFVFEASNSRFCGRLSDNEVKNVKRSQFEIENILKNNFCDNSVTSAGTIEKGCGSYQFSFDEIMLEEKFPKKFVVGVHSDGESLQWINRQNTNFGSKIFALLTIFPVQMFC